LIVSEYACVLFAPVLSVIRMLKGYVTPPGNGGVPLSVDPFSDSQFGKLGGVAASANWNGVVPPPAVSGAVYGWPAVHGMSVDGLIVGSGFTVTLKFLLALAPLISWACTEKGGYVVGVATLGAVPVRAPVLLSIVSQLGNPWPLHVRAPVPPVAAIDCE